jgi:hypothetical protein
MTNETDDERTTMLERFRKWWDADYEPVLLDEPLRSETVELLRAGKTVDAIGIANRRTRIGLVAAKRAVEHLAELEGLAADISSGRRGR